MASTVLSGSSNVSYTNNTGQNVRVVINYMSGVVLNPSDGYPYLYMSFGSSGTISAIVQAIGRNLAFSTGISGSSGGLGGLYGAISANNMAASDSPAGREFINVAFPTEVMLAAGQSFSATCGPYNIVVIPEA